MKITSPAFGSNQYIPAEFTCRGYNMNPPLDFSDIPQDAKSLVLIVDDPDAPAGTWVHWIVYNINPSVVKVDKNSIPDDGIQAITTSGNTSYDGPCPPSGTHRYFFKLYALNKKLKIEGKVDIDSISDAMQDSIIESAELIGLCSKQ